MWRRLLRFIHPDAGGDGDLFVWCKHLQEHVAVDALETPLRAYERPRRTTTSDSPRIDYAAAFDRAGSFDGLTRQAVALANEVGHPHAGLLRLLADCRDAGATGGTAYRQQHQGATYKQLAAIGHRAGMTKTERTAWYRVCESIPLSQRHAGHILGRLQDRAA